MASDAVSPSSTCMTLFFLLIILHSTMANNIKINEADKKNAMELITTRRHGIGISKTFSSTRQSVPVATDNAIHVPPPARRKGRFGAHRGSPFPWQEKIFNASEHEVPSGPNPISNR